MNKLAQWIEELPIEDIRLIEKDLKKGNLQKVITQEIQRKKRENITLCPVCNSAVQEAAGWYVEFGNADLRKKVTFDGVDCMLYFFQKHKIEKKSNDT